MQDTLDRITTQFRGFLSSAFTEVIAQERTAAAAAELERVRKIAGEMLKEADLAAIDRRIKMAFDELFRRAGDPNVVVAVDPAVARARYGPLEGYPDPNPLQVETLPHSELMRAATSERDTFKEELTNQIEIAALKKGPSFPVLSASSTSSPLPGPAAVETSTGKPPATPVNTVAPDPDAAHSPMAHAAAAAAPKKEAEAKAQVAKDSTDKKAASSTHAQKHK
jgi:hypothetical protein